MFYFWGQGYHSATLTDRNANWGEEQYLNDQFEKMRTKFVDNGVPVATFDSDAPASKRFVTYGVDDIDCGRQTMEELVKVMGGKHFVAHIDFAGGARA